MQPLLEIKDLSIDFVTEAGTNAAAEDISLSVNRGEIVAIVGESGSGKSVTALSVLGLLPRSTARYRSGSILFSPGTLAAVDLLTISEEGMRKVRGNQIGMIFQEPMTSLNPVFTCGSQVRGAIRAHKRVSLAEATRLTLELFTAVKLPNPASLFHRYPHQLSGGQKQRVMIAMAMCCAPSLLICDEPTTALDVTVQKNILELIRELCLQQKIGVIFITHDLGVVAEIADRAYVLYQGRIVEHGEVSRIFRNPSHPYTRGLLNCRPVLHPRGQRLPVVSDFLQPLAKQALWSKTADPVDKLQKRDTESKDHALAGAQGHQASHAQAEVLIRVQNLCVWFPEKRGFWHKSKTFLKAVDDISFEIYTGETLGLVGESGCGKTTLGRCLLQLVASSSGKIYYKDVDFSTFSPAQLKKLRKDIQIIFQDPYSSLNPRLTIGSAIMEPMRVHGLLLSDRKRRERVVELLEKVDLKADHYQRYPHEFSGGQRQRAVIARALALNPSFLVCDESVSALDVSVQAQVLNLLDDLKKEFGFTVVFISHDLSVVHHISDRIMVMNKGKIEEIGNAADLYAAPQKAYTRGLIDSIPRGFV